MMTNLSFTHMRMASMNKCEVQFTDFTLYTDTEIMLLNLRIEDLKETSFKISHLRINI